MMKFGCGPAMGRLSAILMILGAVLLIAACSSSDGDKKVEVEVPADGDGTPGDNGEPVMTDLGEWNTLMAGSLDISDANGALRAYYDSEGVGSEVVGRVVADAPVQPAGTGTATWNGMWSGKIAVKPEDAPLVGAGLGAYGVSPDDLAALGGAAQVTAFFEADGVKAELTYQDLGLDAIGLSEITSDRVPVTDGRFEPEKMYSHSFVAETTHPFDPEAPPTPTPTTATGNFTGKGAFGGTDAAGVVGYVDGPVTIEYGRGPTSVGTFQSVFYGTKDAN